MTAPTATLADFILARIAEDEAAARDQGADAMVGHRWKHAPENVYRELQAEVLANSRRVLDQCAALRKVVELHESWPVLVSQPPKFETVEMGDPNNIAMRASQQMEWLTQQEYRERFSDEPPTAPMLRALAAIWADHEDYRDEWRP